MLNLIVILPVARRRFDKRVVFLVVGLLKLFTAAPLALSQLSAGDIVAITAGPVPGSPSSLVRVAAATGMRTVVSDFRNADQGPLISWPGHVAVESPASVLVFDLGDGGLLRPRIVRVVLPGGVRTVLSDFANSSQGTVTGGSAYGPNVLVMGPPGWAYVVVGSLYRIDLSTGQRVLVSNMSDSLLGDVLGYVTGLAVDGGGDILLIGSRTREDVLSQKLYRVSPSSGQRNAIADLRTIAPTALLFQGLAVEPSGSVIALDTLTGAWRVNPSTGAAIQLSNFGNPGHGPALGMAPWTVAAAGGSIFVGGWNTFRTPAGTTYFQGAVFRLDPVTGIRTVLSDFGNPGHGPTLEGTIPDLDVVGGGSSPPSSGLTMAAGGVATNSTAGTASNVRAGYATVAVNAGAAPYGTAVFSLRQNGVVVSEAGVPASPPTQRARTFIDYRTGVPAGIGRLDIFTGLAIAHRGAAAADITYTLRDRHAQTLAIGHGTLAVGAHFAKFIHQMRDVAPDFDLPVNFSTATQFGSLEITSSQPLSIIALRLTTNQRGETLLTSTPIADLSAASTNSPVYFPHLADGGGYTTGLVLLNTSTETEAGIIEMFDDAGRPLTLRETGGIAASTFSYSIPPGGTFVLQSDGSSNEAQVGWVLLTPHPGAPSPVGAGMFSFSPAGILVTESGVPSATPTTRARIYVDKSGGHDTGLAVANPGASVGRIVFQAFQNDGSTPAGEGVAVVDIPSKGHSAKFVGQLISGLPEGFTGAVQVDSTTPFVALTLRSLSNARGDFLLTTFPIADANQPAPAPIVFPQIADGGGYRTQFIFISPSGSATITVNLLDDAGSTLELGAPH
jgi:hypothetical protein